MQTRLVSNLYRRARSCSEAGYPASLQHLYLHKKILPLQTVQSCYRKLCIVVTEIGALLLPKSEHSRLPKSVHFPLPFTAVVPASNLVIALYYGVPLSDWATGNALPHLHVFNTEGKLLHDLRLAESLKAIAYDKSIGILYGADMEDRLFQYDMSGIL